MIQLMPPLEILRATFADAPQLKELAMVSKAHWGYSAEWMARWANWVDVSPAFLEKYEVYKLIEAGQMLGWCALLLNGERAHLEDLWIRPDRIGTGLGRILFEFAVQRARAGGATRLDLEADPNAVGFYEHMGMVTTGQHKTEMDRTIPTMALSL